MTAEHEGFTRMLFVDAIVGVGFPGPYEVAEHATRGGLARFTGNQHNESWGWERDALENLTLGTLQTLYVSLKTYEATHAG
jgi:hypothetical protein